MINFEQLLRDLRVFADPATPFSSKLVGGDVVHVSMVRDTDREYVFDLNSGSIVARHREGKRYSSLQALLASDEFIDVRKFRAHQRRILLQKQEERGGARPVLEPEGSFISPNGPREVLNRRSFEQALEHNVSDRLSVLLIDGPAGIGKTSLIESVSLTRSAADSSLPPLLHVVSGGSKLTDLSKALAHALQVIRSLVTFDQVPILARLGVIQVAIDGFDELVDPDGYKDAWSALREFLGDVGSGGPIVLSGRDTFFDQQNFERLLANRITNLFIRQARLEPVSPSAAKEFLRKSGWSEPDLEKAQEAHWFRPGTYQLRPFFLAQVGGESGWDELQFVHGSPQSFLVSRMVRREAALLAGAVDISVDDAEVGLWDFFGNIAEDMSIQQSEMVDEAFIAFACESAFESRVPVQDLGKLVHRASSFALLESGGTHGSRRFPHSEFQNQFAARAILRLVLSSDKTTTFIRQAPIAAGVAEAFSDLCLALDAASARLVRSNLMTMLGAEGFSDRSASNIASLLLATLGRGDLEPLMLSSLNISESRVVGALSYAVLKDVSFGHLDARGAECRSISFDECEIGILTIDGSSVLPSKLPSISQIHYEENGRLQIIRAPLEITNILRDRTVFSDPSDLDLPLVRYFDRLCRTFIRQYQIRDHDDDESYRLIKDAFWPVVREILGGRISEQIKVAGGPRSVFFRMENPETLLAPSTDSDGIKVRRLIIARAREMAEV